MPKAGKVEELPPAELAAARTAFAAFLDRGASAARPVVLHDVDADGIAAGVVLEAALRRLGHEGTHRTPTGRDRDAWSPASRAKLAERDPDLLFVLDLGSRAEAVVPAVPTAYIDHHRPGGVPCGGVLITGYTWRPIPTTSLLVHLVAEPLADISDLEWVTSLGILSDLGERAPFELLLRARERYSARWLKEAVALVNAARRASDFEPETAARAILSHASPRELVLDDGDPDVRRLREARLEVQAELAEAKRKPPVFAGKVALVRVRSRCQVHPLVAQIWRSRLPGYLVLAANDGYVPGRVNFSARSSGEMSAIDILRSYPLSDGEGVYGQGHDQASGGSLPVARWNELLRRMGFGPGVLADDV